MEEREKERGVRKKGGRKWGGTRKREGKEGGKKSKNTIRGQGDSV